MNSINIGTASAGSSFGLYKHNRSLSASRHSVARSLYSSSTNMAAAMVASNQGKKNGGDNNNNEDYLHRVLKVPDPVVLRTCTVDESFRRMEELVGSEEEEKNWKGIVIALVVIGVILGLIATAIVLVTPAPEKYEPGLPYTFTMLTNEELRLRTPIFSWVKGSDEYVVYVQETTNTSDNFVMRHVALVQPAQDASTESTLISQDILASRIRNLQSVEASPDTNYALAKVDSVSNSITTLSSYLVYSPSKSLIKPVDGDSKLQYSTWVGDASELVFIKDNNIYYQSNAEASPVPITTDASSTVLNGISDKVYKSYIFPKRESLIWPSDDSSAFVYAKISLQEETTYTTTDKNNKTVLKMGGFKPSLLTLYAYRQASSQKFNLPSAGYLTSVVWMDADRILVVWLSVDHQTESYLICNINSGDCDVNFEYKAPVSIELNWVGLYGDPVYNKQTNEIYAILPDPSYKRKLYRHIAAIKCDKSARSDPGVTYLTSHAWSDHELVGMSGDELFYLSSGANFTHRHLFSLNLESTESTCLTCKEFDSLGNMTYVDVDFSHSYDYVYLSILGPGLPSYHVLPTSQLSTAGAVSTQLDKYHYTKVNDSFTDVHLPIIEYLTVPLDEGQEASVKLILPSIFNREKNCLYELVLVYNNIPGRQIATQEFSLGIKEYLAKNQSYIIALVDVRGSAGRGENLAQAVHGSLGSAEASDITKIISFLTENYETYKVDKNYISVLGTGYGGFVALHALSREGIKCGVVTSSVSSLSKHAGWLTSRYMRESPDDTELNYECSGDHATCTMPLSSSLLVVHGTDDEVVPVDSSLTLMRQLQVAGYEFSQQLYPGVGHDIMSSDISAHYYQTIANYLHECFDGRHKHNEKSVNYCENR